jgi:hypothetical protein
LAAVFSDHGQVEVPADDRHSLRLAFPFEREMGHLFDALGLDVHDYPGEDPDCDAVVASNGGLAYVYLRDRGGPWGQAPDFERDVLPVGRAFWDAHASGRYAPELEGALAGVFARDVSRTGWSGRYRALTPAGELISLESWFSQFGKQYADPVNRLNNLAGPMTGDLLLLGDYARGFYFGAPVKGVHGGLHPHDSGAVMAFGFPGVEAHLAQKMCAEVEAAIGARCDAEGGRQASTADLLTGLMAVI